MKTSIFFEIVHALKKLCQAQSWNIQEVTDYVHDQTLLDDKVTMPDLADHFST
ncbi:hypothetical protein MJH12_16195 [bacterium]|nr:hypothetical protein [bacterium]